jgi:hypothetical protein
MTIKIGIINETDENERRVTADSNFSQHQILLLPSACEAAPVEGFAERRMPNTRERWRNFG